MTIIYNEWKPGNYKPTKRETMVGWFCEKLTNMKVIALFKIK